MTSCGPPGPPLPPPGKAHDNPELVPEQKQLTVHLDLGLKFPGIHSNESE